MPSKVLVVRFSAIGDMVLTTPVVRCLKQQRGAEIHYLTKRTFASVLAGNPCIDQLITIDKSVREVGEQLRAVQYDHVIDLHHNLRSLQVKRLVGAPSSSFPKLNVEKWLLVNFKVDRMPDLHIVERYFKTVERLGVTYDGQGLDFYIDAAARAEAAPLMPAGPYIAMAIGAGLRTKCLEPDQMVTLARQIDLPVILLGGPQDRKVGEHIAGLCPRATNLAGKVSIGASAAVVDGASLLITPDTGLMHIAAALNTPVISVWGNTVPAFGMTPFYADHSNVPQAVIEVPGLPCRPCSKIGYDTCPRGHFRCIRQLPLDRIVNLVHNWLGNGDEVPDAASPSMEGG
ncbi:MAG: glycosyltransferase family 9 protein [Saprospiraceae bacterium]|nr:glycosyltransferase family 9 protein [Saprospiraceae bacterium]